MPANLAYRGGRVPQENSSQSGRSLVFSSKSLHFPSIGSRPIVLFQTDFRLLFTSLAKLSKVDFLLTSSFSATALILTGIFFHFSHDLICTLLTRPAPCPHRRRDPRR